MLVGWGGAAACRQIPAKKRREEKNNSFIPEPRGSPGGSLGVWRPNRLGLIGGILYGNYQLDHDEGKFRKG